MPTVDQRLSWAVVYLQRHEIKDARRSSEILMCFVLNKEPSFIRAHGDEEVSDEQSQEFQKCVEKRAKKFPVAYITGKKEFYGLEYQVNQSVLIPRPETELIIDLVLQRNEKRAIKKILDVGTGSGAIALTLKKELPDVEVVAVDIDEEAIKVAESNAANLNVDIHIKQSDLMKNVEGRFDVIVSNLPYIPSGVIPMLSQEVQKEPMRALDGGESGMDLFDRFLPQAYMQLENDGIIFLEIGYDQKDAIVACARQNGYTDVKVIKDLQGCDRVAVLQK